MPELPEVETIRHGLIPYVIDKTIADVDVFHPRVVRMSPTGVQPIIGHTINAVVRRGKYMWMVTEDSAIVAHLGMSGQFRINSTSLLMRVPGSILLMERA
ncbi:DNA-formamidopyrimidine glycosylase family protein [Arcanobacterium buesumense]|uniref:DNA-formamidopyrimidine glycosylase family protein n=1 Tax=Arcanobacterium buesumense TaxID=2722751 RepID=UPI001FFDD4EB|nr:DNA-formamidopyrimidine glycosylase family protein [Arcanobacterium buesumense]